VVLEAKTEVRGQPQPFSLRRSVCSDFLGVESLACFFVGLAYGLGCLPTASIFLGYGISFRSTDACAVDSAFRSHETLSNPPVVSDDTRARFILSGSFFDLDNPCFCG